MELNRILFFVSSLRRGGAENHLLNLCRYLERSSIKTVVCTLSANEEGLETTFLAESISLWRFPMTSLLDLARPRIIRSLRRIIRSFRPHVIHAHLYHAEVIAALGSLFAAAPLVVTRHSTGLEFEGGRRLLSRFAGRRVDTIVAVSSAAAAEAVATGHPESRVVVVPNGVDTGRFRPPEEHERGERRRLFLRRLFPDVDPSSCLLVGSAGGLKSVKNFPLFIRMAARIVEGRQPDDPPVRFVVLGEGSERDALERHAAHLGATSFLAMPGHCESPEEMYGLFDIFVLTSFREGVPMVLLEAMASGVPCIASDVGGVYDVIGDAGMSVASGDEDGFVNAVEELIADRERRGELARRARVRVLEHYDIEIWGDRMLRVYKETVERNRRR
jgi:glycosyltransferase involved in cell wall biosynthesis